MRYHERYLSGLPWDVLTLNQTSTRRGSPGTRFLPKSSKEGLRRPGRAFPDPSQRSNSDRRGTRPGFVSRDARRGAPNAPAGGNVRDFVVVTSEAGGAFCQQVIRHSRFIVDVTAAAPNNEHRPQGVANFQVPAASGDFCEKGGRFGPHATNENFGPPFYGKVVFISYFNAGVRVVDIRNPYDPQEVGSFIPEVTINTDFRCGTLNGVPNVCKQVIQTNNVETDDRGYVYIVDRANTGLHILQLTGQARKIAEQ